jgi:hypothetical protein
LQADATRWKRWRTNKIAPRDSRLKTTLAMILGSTAHFSRTFVVASPTDS